MGLEENVHPEEDNIPLCDCGSICDLRGALWHPAPARTSVTEVVRNALSCLLSHEQRTNGRQV